jgi:2-polyprenyl-6-methoxyphenol hydroxylase-like FAD-dependent oxidoreductase
VGADGLRSIIARRLGACTRPGYLRKLSLTFHAPVERVSALGEMHVGDGICVGIAPVAGDRCNVTLVADSLRFGRDVAADPHAFARAALDTLPRVRGRVSDAALNAAAPLASGPFDRPVRQVAFDGAVLAGDAAGYYDPFTGQGVYQALASAFLIAPCIDDALRRDDARAFMFSSYVRARAALVRGPRLVQHGIEAVLSRPGLANHAIGRIRDATPFARAILAVTGDIRPARTLLSPLALASLIFRSRPEIAA